MRRQTVGQTASLNCTLASPGGEGKEKGGGGEGKEEGGEGKEEGGEGRGRGRGEGEGKEEGEEKMTCLQIQVHTDARVCVD